MCQSIRNTILLSVFQCCWFGAVAQTLPAFFATSDELYITTANFALYKIDKKGGLVQIHPPPDDFAAALPIFNDFPERLLAGYRATDGRLVLFGDGISRKDPVFLKPKPNRKLLSVSPGVSSIAVWGEGRKLIVEFYDGGYEQSVTLPDEPVAALGQNHRLYVTCRSAVTGRFNTYIKDYEKKSPEWIAGGMLEAGILANDEIPAVSMVTKAGATDSVYFIFNSIVAGARPPGAGRFTCLAVGASNFVVVNEKGECWLGSQNEQQQLVWYSVKVPMGTAIAGAAYVGKDDYRTGKELVLITTSDQILWPTGQATANAVPYTTLTATSLQPLLAKTGNTPKPAVKNAMGAAAPKPAAIAAKAPSPNPSPNPNGVVSSVAMGSAVISPKSSVVAGGYYMATNSRLSYLDIPRHQQVSDLNGDGKADLLVSYTVASYIDMYFNDGTGNLTSHSRLSIASQQGLFARAANLNNDKRADLVVLSYFDSSIHILQYQSGDTYAHQKLNQIKATHFWLGDYNGDGHTDIVAPGAILINNGKAVFTWYQTGKQIRTEQGFIVGTDVGPVYMGGVGDVDGNGTPDFVHPTVGKGFYDGIKIFLMPPAKDLRTIAENKPLNAIKIEAPYDVLALAVADVNGDGKQDIVATCPKAFKMLFYLNKGKGEFDRVEVAAEANFDEAPMIVLDADGDGLMDVIAGLGGNPHVFGCIQKAGLPKAKVSRWGYNKLIQMNRGAFAAGDVTGDAIADFVTFDAHLDKIDATVSCGAEYCMAFIQYKGKVSNGNLVIEEREEPNNMAALANRGNAGLASGNASSNQGSSATKKDATTEVPKNLRRGIAYYKGRSSDGLAIEVEAEVWYEDKTPKGMAGFRYKHIYQANCLRYRFPGNSSTWYSFKGNTVDQCYENNYYFNCVYVKGMRFKLNEPGIQ